MHRFLDFHTVEHARVALRADGSLWLIADEGRFFEVDRGAGWAGVCRLRLCGGDRVRLGDAVKTMHDLCQLLGIDPEASAASVPLTSAVPGVTAPSPLSAPARVIENARRNPGTGQVEPSKENQ